MKEQKRIELSKFSSRKTNRDLARCENLTQKFVPSSVDCEENLLYPKKCTEKTVLFFM